VLGVVWTLLAVAFAGAAVVTWTGRRAWPRALGSVALASLALLLVALWSSAIGVVVDLGLLGVAWRAGALRSPERTAR
jgi:tryptophan-rich sensory protein